MRFCGRSVPNSVQRKALNTIDKARDLTGASPLTAYVTAAQIGWDWGWKLVNASADAHAKTQAQIERMNAANVPEKWTRASGSPEVAGRAIVNPQTLRGIAVVTATTGLAPSNYGNDKPAKVDNRLRTVLIDTSNDANKSKHWYDDAPGDDFITSIVKAIARVFQWQ